MGEFLVLRGCLTMRQCASEPCQVIGHLYIASQNVYSKGKLRPDQKGQKQVTAYFCPPSIRLPNLVAQTSFLHSIASCYKYKEI